MDFLEIQLAPPSSIEEGEDGELSVEERELRESLLQAFPTRFSDSRGEMLDILSNPLLNEKVLASILPTRRTDILAYMGELIALLKIPSSRKENREYLEKVRVMTPRLEEIRDIISALNPKDILKPRL